MNYNKEKLIELKGKLHKADFEYYVMNTPTLSDAQYDRLQQEYIELENQYPEFRMADSPTQRIGCNVLEKFEKTTHRTPLLSIDQKAKTTFALKSFYNNCGGNGTEIIIQPKYDGLTINATYNNNLFIEGATRGNGYIGEVITENVKTIRSVPLNIPFEKTVEVRGEAIVDLKTFNSNFSDEYSNPRNFVAGTMRQLDPKTVASRKADIVFYDVGICENEFKTGKDTERLEWLKTQGFKVTPYIVVNNVDDLLDVCLSGMNNLISEDGGFNVLHKNEICTNNVDNIVCDGLVLKVNDLKLREELGMTAKGPKWAFAYKFKSIQAITKLNEVIWQVGRTGKITPVAVFDTVNIGGTSVSRATLNNIDYIKSLEFNYAETIVLPEENSLVVNNEVFRLEDITSIAWMTDENNKSEIIFGDFEILGNHYFVRFSKELEQFTNIPSIKKYLLTVDLDIFTLKIGDLIVVERSNDVIPRIIGIAESNYFEHISVPDFCPECGEPVKEIYPQHFCTNLSCPARLKGALTQFVSRDAMNIEGLGKSIIDILVNEGFLNSIFDIYLLKEKKEQIVNLDGFGEKRINKILENIEKSKQNKLDKFLVGLGIEEVGRSLSKVLAKHFISIDNFMNVQKEELILIEDIGDIVAQYIIAFTNNNSNRQLIEKLKNVGFTFENNTIMASTKLMGKSFVVTGTLKEKRSYYQDLIEQNGGKLASSVSPKTYAVIIGTDAGEKETKARGLVQKGHNIIIIEGHDEFHKFMEL